MKPPLTRGSSSSVSAVSGMSVAGTVSQGEASQIHGMNSSGAMTRWPMIRMVK
jgi:hypothetical protein